MPENKNDIDLEGWDLHRAAEKNRVDTARALIARGDDAEGRDNYGYTPLRKALYFNSLDVARLLIEYGANIEAKDKFGWRPLEHVVASNFPRAARLLIDLGADTDRTVEAGVQHDTASQLAWIPATSA